MNYHFTRISLRVLFAFLFSLIYENGSSTENKPTLRNNELSFIENKGQLLSPVNTNVLYYIEGSSVNCFLKKNGLSYVWQSRVTSEDKKLTSYQMDLEFLNSNASVNVHSEDATESVNNYYLGHCPQGILGVKSFRKVIYENIYDKIDLVFYVADGSDINNSIPIKYDFVVKPGGDPKQIKINYLGNKKMKLDGDGSLTAYCPLGELKEGKPYSYQHKNEFEKTEIVSSYELDKQHTISFHVSNYDKNQNLIIDPSVQWATYYGGTGKEWSTEVEADAAGNIYLCGETVSPGLSTPNSYQPALAGTSNNLILVKFSDKGTRLWATYLGTNLSNMTPTDMVLDKPESNIIITGLDGGSAFLAKFNSTGALQWRNKYGSSFTIAHSVTVDNNNNIFLAGLASTETGISTPGSFKPVLQGGSSSFLIKCDPSGNKLWGTYYGANTTGWFVSTGFLATDSQNNVYMTGTTWADPTYDVATSGTGIYQPNPGGQMDGFLVKFNSSGQRLWGTYYGGPSNENPTGIAVDAADDIIIVGRTSSTTGIATVGAYQTTFGGGADLFVAKFNPTGGIKWGTYYGGSSTEVASDREYASVAVFPNKKIVVCSTTSSTNNIATATGDEIQTNQGGYDAFIVRFSETGTREWASYYGGTGADYGEDVDVNAVGDMFMAGNTVSTSGIALRGHQNVQAGLQDLFLVKYGPTITTVSMTPATLVCNASRSIAFTTTGIFNTPGNSFTAEISDPNGNFDAPGYPIAMIGSGTSSPITVTLPYVIAGTGYKIRVVSSSPGVKGTAIGPYTIAASTLVGATLANPIIAGTLTCNVQYTDTKNNSTANCYGNDYDVSKNATQIQGQRSDDVYYKFTITQAQRVSISTCFSSLNTYIHLLNSSGINLASNDIAGPVCKNANMASIAKNLAAGDYYVVVEGSGVSSGSYTLDICLSTILGSTLDNPINAGTLTCNTPYTGAIVNNSPSNCYGDNYNAQKHPTAEILGQPSDDIYYLFSINRVENVTISTCNSSIDTYVHLYDYALNYIASNNDGGPKCATNKASIVRTLSKGLYFVVVEGNGTAAGNIKLELSATPGLKFIDQSDLITLPESPLLDLGTGPFTFEANVALKASDRDYSNILSDRNDRDQPDGFLFSADNTTGRLFLELKGITLSAPASSPTLFDDKCHHVAGTRDASGVVKLYLDGALLATSTITTNISGTRLTIGWGSLGSGNLNGYIRDLRIWNVARTQALIQANREIVLAPQAGLVGYWRLLEGSGPTAVDYSGNNLTGTLSNLGGTPGPAYVCAPGCLYLRPASGDDVTDVSNAIENSSEEIAVSVYPNPFSQTTNIIITGKTEKAIVEILDVNGSLVYKSENYVTNETITLGENIHAGFYVLRVTTAEGSKSLKLIKTE